MKPMIVLMIVLFTGCVTTEVNTHIPPVLPAPVMLEANMCPYIDIFGDAHYPVPEIAADYIP